MVGNIKKPRTGLLSRSAAQEQRLKKAVIQREFPNNLIALSNLSENFEQNVGNLLLIFSLPEQYKQVKDPRDRSGELSSLTLIKKHIGKSRMAVVPHVRVAGAG